MSRVTQEAFCEKASDTAFSTAYEGKLKIARELTFNEIKSFI